MATAKDIVLKPIPKKDADDLIKKVHYSGKIVQNSQIHIGVFLHGKLEGAMQFGPSLDKRKTQKLVLLKRCLAILRAERSLLQCGFSKNTPHN